MIKFSSSILAILISIIITTCAHTPVEILSGKVLPYKHLSSVEQASVRDIINDIKDLPGDEQEYFYNKLNLLLATKTLISGSDERNDFSVENKKRLDDASERVESEYKAMPTDELAVFLLAEEEYETYGIRKWEAYRPDGLDAHFLVDRSDPTDLLVKIWIHVRGDRKIVDTIVSFEDAIEKHVSIEGFSVNIVFLDHEEPEAFIIDSEIDRWITSDNWGGSPETMGHELMHLFGLPDEYDGIASHAGNEHLSMTTRLWYFKKQLSEPFLPDARNGIMCNNYMRPLDRHACAAVGLPVKSCLKARLNYLK